jgi:polar amino acid transport system substrate-binding protein
VNRPLTVTAAVAILALAAFGSGAHAAGSQAGSSGAYYTSAQAAGGGKAYAANCSQCHGAKLEGMSGPALKGPAMKGSQAVRDIYAVVSQQMPASAPGSLSPPTYAAIMAFLLQQNGHPAGKTALTPASAKKISAKI